MKNLHDEKIMIEEKAAKMVVKIMVFYCNQFLDLMGSFFPRQVI